MCHIATLLFVEGLRNGAVGGWGLSGVRSRRTHAIGIMGDLWPAKKQEDSRAFGWHPSCSCPPHAPVPCIVCDPFCGSGTTLVVANALGRRGIGLDLSREYLVNQAQRRLERPHGPVLRPARVEPALPLFGDIDP